MTSSSHDAHVVPFGWDKGLQGRALFLIAIAFSAFQIVVAAYHPFSSQVVRAIHVGFMLLMSFALLQHWLPRRQVPVMAWLVGLTAFGLARRGRLVCDFLPKVIGIGFIYCNRASGWR